MFNHQTAILDNLNTGASERLRGLVVANARLKPHGFRFLRQNIVYVAVDILRAAKDINQIDFPRNVNQAPIYRRTKDLCDLGVIDRNRNYFEAGSEQILRHVDRRLSGLRFRLDAQNGDSASVHDQLSDLRPTFNQIVFPVHARSIATAASTRDAGFLEPLKTVNVMQTVSLIFSLTTLTDFSRIIATVYCATINATW